MLLNFVSLEMKLFCLEIMTEKMNYKVFFSLLISRIYDLKLSIYSSKELFKTDSSILSF